MRRKRIWRYRLMGAVFFFLSLLAAPSHAERAGNVVLVGEIRGVINPVSAGYVNRLISRGEMEHVNLIVIQLDTPGGLETSMREIIQKIINSSVPVAVYVSPHGARAASAGVLITMSAHIAAMAPSTNIGSAHPVNLVGPSQEDKVMLEKITNDAVAFARTLAKRHGRNADWAEDAVRKSVSVTEEIALKKKVVDLVVPSLDSLLAEVDGRKTTTSMGAVKVRTRGAEIRRAPMNGVERFLFIISNPNIAFILMLLGVMGMIYEVTSPGALLPGIIGGICILLAWFSLGSLPINYAGLFLIILAFILFIAETQVLTHGALTIGGLISFVLGSLMLINSEAPYYTISRTLIFSTALLFAVFFSIVVTSAVRAQRRKPASGGESLVGKEGVARTALDPTGDVFLCGERWKGESQSGPIAEGEKIVVVSVAGLTLGIKKKEG
ncbi:MAG: nodulation protein NfeD [Armatimonadetes bacterium]|nr:nodulation protein NfeD [Armatimonadota bacterium]